MNVKKERFKKYIAIVITAFFLAACSAEQRSSDPSMEQEDTPEMMENSENVDEMHELNEMEHQHMEHHADSTHSQHMMENGEHMDEMHHNP